VVTLVLEYAWEEGAVEANWSVGRERRKRITQRRRVRRESAEELRGIAWGLGFLVPAGSRRDQAGLGCAEMTD
jgi:hypothetical protein